jgi:hypothetical protein
MTPWEAVNDLTYLMIFTRPQDTADTVRRLALVILERRVLTAGPQAYYDGMREMLDSPSPIGNPHGVPYSDAELRAVFRGLMARLDQLRPWPDPAPR